MEDLYSREMFVFMEELVKICKFEVCREKLM